jgi:hypothetical protein
MSEEAARMRVWESVGRGWRASWNWRRHRPFGAGVLLAASGVVILLPPYASFRLGDLVISVNTLGGISALVLGGLLVLCAAVVWVRPQRRLVAGLVGMLAALIALVTANFGGFFLGTLLGLVGGALAVAWTESPRPAHRARHRRERVVRTSGA